MGATVAIAVAKRREREVRQEFHSANALQPIDAHSIEELGLEQNRTFKRLCNRSVIREASPGMFYWDEDVWQSLRSMRFRMALMLVGAILLVGIMLAYGSTQLK